MNLRVTCVTESNSARIREEHIFRDTYTCDTLALSLVSGDCLLETLTYLLPKERATKISFTVQRTDDSSVMAKSHRKGKGTILKVSESPSKLALRTLKLHNKTSAPGAAIEAHSMSSAVSLKRKRTEPDKKSCGSSEPPAQEKPKVSSDTSEKEETEISTGKRQKKVSMSPVLRHARGTAYTTCTPFYGYRY